eukprot:SAG25_NODE_4351_length_835_cov_1.046196_2_plen_40_part_01
MCARVRGVSCSWWRRRLCRVLQSVGEASGKQVAHALAFAP